MQHPFQPTVHDLHNNGRAFPPNHLHQSWLDYLYWDIELEPSGWTSAVPITIIVPVVSTEARMAISADLGKTLEAVVEDLVENGRYNSKSEVLREGVRLVQEREAELRRLDAALARGMADIEAGRVKPAEEVFDRLIAKYEAMAKRKKRA
jgi:antitoxin ParD1/3/4